MDVGAAAGLFESEQDAFVLDDQDGWQARDAEAFAEVCASLVVDPVDLEGVVVLPVLENLGEEAFNSSRLARGLVVEEDQSRAVVDFGVCACLLFGCDAHGVRGSAFAATSAARPSFSTTR